MGDSKADSHSASSAQADPPSTEKSASYDAEEAEYDPFAERQVAHPTSDAGALAHLLKCSLGSGILAMPYAFLNGGLWFGLVFTLIVGFVCAHCALILVKSSHIVSKKAKKPSLSYPETGAQAFATGPPAVRKYAGFARTFVKAALVSTYYGALTVYLVFVAGSFKKVVDANIDCENQLSIRIWIAILFVPLAMLCLIRDLKYLVPFSWIANCFIVVGFGITLYCIFTDLKSPDGLPSVGKVGNIPIFLSTVIFAMEGIGVVMPVENSMKNPSHFLGCPGVLNIAMSVVVAFYTIIGFFGYLAYREGTDASITFNLPEGHVETMIVQGAVALAILFTYPLQFYVGTEIILDILKDRIRKERFSMFQNFYRVAVVAITVGVAVAIPNLGPIISLVGAIFFSILGLLLPAIIETVACYDGMLGRGNWILIKNIIIGIFAILILIFGTYASILEIIDEYSGNNDNNSTDTCKTTTEKFLNVVELH